MADLKLQGFEMFDRHKDITLEHAVLVMKVLGKLHAVSYAIRVIKVKLINTKLHL